MRTFDADRVDGLRKRPSPGMALTQRQRVILALVAADYTNAAIATRLFISADTVGTHMSNMLLKLNVHSRAAAVHKGWIIGYLDLDTVENVKEGLRSQTVAQNTRSV